MTAKIHPTAIISKNATIGSNTSIGPYTILEDNVVIGDNCNIDGFCQLGIKSPAAETEQLIISNNSHIRSHSNIYTGSVFGVGLQTGHNITVRENTRSGNGFQIGSYSDIQGDCTIGNYVKTQSYVFIPKKTIIGNFVWLFPRVTITNDPYPPSDNWLGVKINDYAIIGAGSLILPGITIGQDTLIAAASCVTKDIATGDIVKGIPAKTTGKTADLMLPNTNQPAYPWRARFHRGYPKDVVSQWLNEIR